MKVLEFYSGIGGMHYALKESGCPGQVLLSVDINTTANKVYKHNFPETNLINKNIQSLTSNFLNSFQADTILMSPPCQPFTRNGLQNDVNDPRTESFLYILSIIPDLNIENILIENVKGFETSIMRDKLIECLQKQDYNYQEFLLNPVDFGIPNSRLRYYCLAKKSKFRFENGTLLENLPIHKTDFKTYKLNDYLDINLNESEYYLPLKTSKYWPILDICNADSIRSCCFTKAYGRFLEGTGSVLSNYTKEFLDKLFKDYSKQDDETLKSIKLRYFTPKEISRLLCFPENFLFPNEISRKQKYMLLGNSINVKVVSELIKLLQ